MVFGAFERSLALEAAAGLPLSGRMQRLRQGARTSEGGRFGGGGACFSVWAMTMNDQTIIVHSSFRGVFVLPPRGSC